MPSGDGDEAGCAARHSLQRQRAAAGSDDAARAASRARRGHSAVPQSSPHARLTCLVWPSPSHAVHRRALPVPPHWESCTITQPAAPRAAVLRDPHTAARSGARDGACVCRVMPTRRARLVRAAREAELRCTCLPVRLVCPRMLPAGKVGARRTRAWLAAEQRRRLSAQAPALPLPLRAASIAASAALL